MKPKKARKGQKWIDANTPPYHFEDVLTYSSGHFNVLRFQHNEWWLSGYGIVAAPEYWAELPTPPRKTK